MANKNAKKNDEYPAIFMEQAWSIFKGLITWPKRELIIAGPTPSVQEGLIFPSRTLGVGPAIISSLFGHVINPLNIDQACCMKMAGYSSFFFALLLANI